ncbi:hypothetical protein HDU89_002051 [Geranomyces variabilis]|nr:hypothetical protein HDU89_002051 [Geranomyces variabilis]
MYVLCTLPSGAKLRYSHGASSANKTDKALRQSTSRAGKKVDYLLKSGGNELGVGENSGGGRGMKAADPAHVSGNFIDLVKIGIAQVRRISTKISADLAEHGLLLTEPMKELLSDVAVPSFQ